MLVHRRLYGISLLWKKRRGQDVEYNWRISPSETRFPQGRMTYDAVLLYSRSTDNFECFQDKDLAGTGR